MRRSRVSSGLAWASVFVLGLLAACGGDDFVSASGGAAGTAQDAGQDLGAEAGNPGTGGAGTGGNQGGSAGTGTGGGGIGGSGMGGTTQGGSAGDGGAGAGGSQGGSAGAGASAASAGSTPGCTPACDIVHTCDAQQCVCASCPFGTVVGMSAGSCMLPGGTVATSPSAQQGHPASAAVDGSASTFWHADIFAVPGGGSGILSIQLPQAVPMGGIVLSVNALNGSGGTASTINYDITVTDDKNLETALPVKTADVANGGDEVWIPFQTPTRVTRLVIEADSQHTAISLFEVAFRACPP
ncbi:MAG: discoidin domain-containing protein [Deltaproteobacteria bacterium]|nr:discoidin domain-containing protein [Deltaproteobacteria bacterium]